MAKSSTNLLKRRLDIAEIVRKKGEITVEDLTQILSVSGVTIRSDLNYLEQQGYLKRSFGGAIYISQHTAAAVADRPAKQQLDKLLEIEIAHQLAALVEDRETVFLGPGSLLRKSIPFLANYSDMYFVFNDLEHTPLMRDYINGETVLLGGVLSAQGHVLEGELSIEFLRRYKLSRALFLVDHIAEDGTLSVTQSGMAHLLSEALKISNRSVAVVSRRPVLGEKRYTVGQLSRLHAIVTPQVVAAEFHASFQAAGFINSYTNNECLTWLNPASKTQSEG